MKKKLTALFLVVVMCMTLGVPAFASNGASSSESMVREIDALIEKKVKYALAEDTEKLNEVNAQLARYGVEELSTEEVIEQFGGDDVAIPMIEKPDSVNTSWTSWRQQYDHSNGTRYEVQHLIATPATEESGLEQIGTLAEADDISPKSQWIAGSENAIYVIAETTLGEIIDFEASTLFDIVGGYIPSMTKATAIENAKIAYSYGNYTTVAFVYVKVYGESDDEQELALVTSKCATDVGYVYTQFIPSTGNEIVNDSQQYNTTPETYKDRAEFAVDAYIDGTTVYDHVDYVDIIGVDNTAVYEILPMRPTFPLQLS